MRSYRLLVAAITVRAVEDYKKALKQLDSNPAYEDAIITKNEIEAFFESDWFKFLCEINDVSRILKKENILNDK